MQPHNQLPGAFETNKKSNAALDLEKYKPDVYYQGCLWGGKVPEVCAMIDELMDRTNDDLKKISLRYGMMKVISIDIS